MSTDLSIFGKIMIRNGNFSFLENAEESLHSADELPDKKYAIVEQDIFSDIFRVGTGDEKEKEIKRLMKICLTNTCAHIRYMTFFGQDVPDIDIYLYHFIDLCDVVICCMACVLSNDGKRYKEKEFPE